MSLAIHELFMLRVKPAFENRTNGVDRSCRFILVVDTDILTFIHEFDPDISDLDDPQLHEPFRSVLIFQVHQ